MKREQRGKREGKKRVRRNSPESPMKGRPTASSWKWGFWPRRRTAGVEEESGREPGMKQVGIPMERHPWVARAQAVQEEWSGVMGRGRSVIGVWDPIEAACVRLFDVREEIVVVEFLADDLGGIIRVGEEEREEFFAVLAREIAYEVVDVDCVEEVVSVDGDF
jgi:hypothetical protein